MRSRLPKRVPFGGWVAIALIWLLGVPLGVLGVALISFGVSMSGASMSGVDIAVWAMVFSVPLAALTVVTVLLTRRAVAERPAVMDLASEAAFPVAATSSRRRVGRHAAELLVAAAIVGGFYVSLWNSLGPHGDYHPTYSGSDMGATFDSEFAHLELAVPSLKRVRIAADLGGRCLDGQVTPSRSLDYEVVGQSVADALRDIENHLKAEGYRDDHRNGPSVDPTAWSMQNRNGDLEVTVVTSRTSPTGLRISFDAIKAC